MKKLADIGYNSIETAGYHENKFYGYPPKEFQTLVKSFGINPLSSHSNITIDNAEQTIEDALNAGMKYLVKPSIPENKRPILIVGLPRSGTTWIGQVLSSADRVEYVYEPDNERRSVLAWICKSEMHRFPYFTAGDVTMPYDVLWRAILTGRASVRMANRVLRPILKRLLVSTEH